MLPTKNYKRAFEVAKVIIRNIAQFYEALKLEQCNTFHSISGR